MTTTHRHQWYLLATMALATAGCSAAHDHRGQVAADFRLDSLTGQSVTLSQYKGNVVLLGFWAVG